jgi:hypothetical protein
MGVTWDIFTYGGGLMNKLQKPVFATLNFPLVRCRMRGGGPVCMAVAGMR